ncbi:unnamed protein product [Rotaria socialis]|uniref:Uncharacterized protein n=1 Tax=Rotaria socialis TaxID=392032 RepID=A0A818WK18_9BILA|nr:unnamed protein product [Rotaria socialis]CAF4816959.1 unnamed protein product [Rotaria socialis]
MGASSSQRTTTVYPHEKTSLESCQQVSMNNVPISTQNDDIENDHRALNDIDETKLNIHGNSIPIIWLDAAVHETEENVTLKGLLKRLTKKLTSFDDGDLCIRYIQQLAMSEQVIFIVSGSMGNNVIPTVRDLVQVKIIYIYCKEKTYYRKKFDLELYPKASTNN